MHTVNHRITRITKKHKYFDHLKWLASVISTDPFRPELHYLEIKPYLTEDFLNPTSQFTTSNGVILHTSLIPHGLLHIPTGHYSIEVDRDKIDLIYSQITRFTINTEKALTTHLDKSQNMPNKTLPDPETDIGSQTFCSFQLKIAIGLKHRPNPQKTTIHYTSPPSLPTPILIQHELGEALVMPLN